MRFDRNNIGEVFRRVYAGCRGLEPGEGLSGCDQWAAYRVRIPGRLGVEASEPPAETRPPVSRRRENRREKLTARERNRSPDFPAPELIIAPRT